MQDNFQFNYINMRKKNIISYLKVKILFARTFLDFKIKLEYIMSNLNDDKLMFARMESRLIKLGTKF